MAAVFKAGVRGMGMSDVAFAAALAGLQDTVFLTAAVGLGAECEDAVSMLCLASGVYDPAPPGGALEGRQLQVRCRACTRALAPGSWCLDLLWQTPGP